LDFHFVLLFLEGILCASSMCAAGIASALALAAWEDEFIDCGTLVGHPDQTAHVESGVVCHHQGHHNCGLCVWTHFVFIGF
jgi:hypothetical protein